MVVQITRFESQIIDRDKLQMHLNKRHTDAQTSGDSRSRNFRKYQESYTKTLVARSCLLGNGRLVSSAFAYR
jgi:hypothetical protein